MTGSQIPGSPPGYPGHRIVDVGLLDGSTIRLRPVVPRDAGGVLDLFSGLSDESRRLRFHGSRPVQAKEADYFTQVNYRTTFGLVAERRVEGQLVLVGLASYISLSPGVAEMAIVVDDAFHGVGIGSLLIEHLSEAAEEAGIHTFSADILGDNASMQAVVRNSELPRSTSASQGVVHVEFPTTPTTAALEAFENREAIAAAASMRLFLEPRSVAVIGASRRRGTIGGELFQRLTGSGFAGTVFPVNPKADMIGSLVAYPSVSDLPTAPDLAVIVVPAKHVLEVAEACGEKGVRALLIISSGFSEVGKRGSELQRRLLETCRSYGMRIVGPNCMGLMNLDPEISLDATFAPFSPPIGNLAFSSQSGALGIAVIDAARRLGLGMSSFVSVGNKADISGNDLLQYWEQDPRTHVILLYLESFGNPRKFARIARRVSRHKPIVAVKSGRSSAGARAAASHTGSLAAGDAVVDALFHQAGVIRTDTLEELFDVASLLAHQPLPEGDRVGVLTNAGGLGILAADACEGAGLTLPSLTRKTLSGLRKFLPTEASFTNPVDMIASATAEDYGRAIDLLASDRNIDALIIIFIPPLVTKAEDVARSIVHATRGSSKTVLTCFIGTQGMHDLLQDADSAVPSFAFPESAAKALGRVATYAAWCRRPDGVVPDLVDIDRRVPLSILSKHVNQDRWLNPQESSELLDSYGIRVARSRVVEDVTDVAASVQEFDGPVAIKAVSQQIVHKTDVEAVRLHLSGPAEASEAAREMLDQLIERGLGAIEGFLIQEMVDDHGAEIFVGMTLDPTFGPLLACGSGGTLVELIRDVAVRITPLTDLEAHEMITSMRTYPILEGYRGSPKLDIGALQDLLLRVSVMVEDNPQIAEMDLNPVFVLPEGEGCRVVDARIRVAPSGPSAPRGARLTPGEAPRFTR